MDRQVFSVPGDVIRTVGPAAAAGGEMLAGMIRKHRIELIAIGNGTASRETDEFVGGGDSELWTSRR